MVVAEHQSAGRGRLGRRWEAPTGANLLMSVLLRPRVPPASRHLITAVVALAAADAMAELTDVVPGLKWPNDVLAPDGRKLAGVLAEADLSPANPATDGSEGTQAVVVGVGINANWPVSDLDLPEELAGKATSLRQQTGTAVDKEALLEALLQALEPRVEALAAAPGRSDQSADLRRRCVTLGASVRVDLATGSLVGTAVDLTVDGHLVVRTEAGDRTVVAGDVVHLRPAD